MNASRIKLRVVVLILPAALVFLSLTGCDREGNKFAPPPPPAVTVAHPVERPVSRFVESTGTTEPFEAVDLRARVPGFLEQINFKPGAVVKKGDLLFVIDRRTYQAAVDRAQALVHANEAAHKAAESDAKIFEELVTQRAGSELDRITKVGRRDSALAEVEASKAALANAKLDLEFCEVRAPIDGRITKNLVDIGNYVGGAGQPTVLATIVSAKPIYVTIDSSESNWNLVRNERLRLAPDSKPGEIAPGKQRPVHLATAEDATFSIAGRLDYVDPVLDAASGTIRVRCRFENENEALIPGMFVRLRVMLQERSVMLTPDIALLSDQGGRFAMVVSDKDVVEARRVKIGDLDGALRVIEGGLTRSDRVIVNGLQRARPGITVTATLTELPPPPAPPASATQPTAAARVNAS
jgi:RND family efflux transporter MFP subunit